MLPNPEARKPMTVGELMQDARPMKDAMREVAIESQTVLKLIVVAWVLIKDCG